MTNETAADKDFRCATVAIIGRPNAGKSTLMNALLQSELSATSPRPQTTRTNVRGILQIYSAGKNRKWEAQIILVDTPGVNLKRGALDRSLYTSVEEALRAVDVIVWVSDPRTWLKDLRDLEMEKPGEDRLLLWLKDQMDKKNVDNKWVLALTKADTLKKPALLPILEKTAELMPAFADVVPVAALLPFKDKNSNLSGLLEVIKANAPVAPAQYPEDYWTDLNEKQLVQNLVREAIFRNSYDEVPYESDCVIERFVEPEGKKKMAEVDASIIVTRSALKTILVGKGGTKVRDMGIAVRKKYKELTGDDIVLRLHVKVEAKWNTQTRFLKELGYDTKS